MVVRVVAVPCLRVQGHVVACCGMLGACTWKRPDLEMFCLFTSCGRCFALLSSVLSPFFLLFFYLLFNSLFVFTSFFLNSCISLVFSPYIFFTSSPSHLSCSSLHFSVMTFSSRFSFVTYIFFICLLLFFLGHLYLFRYCLSHTFHIIFFPRAPFPALF